MPQEQDKKQQEESQKKPESVAAATLPAPLTELEREVVPESAILDLFGMSDAAWYAVRRRDDKTTRPPTIQLGRRRLYVASQLLDWMKQEAIREQLE
jgi:hypothetical protein